MPFPKKRKALQFTEQERGELESIRKFRTERKRRVLRAAFLLDSLEELAPYLRGWRSYFGFCERPNVLIGLTGWVRLRLRAAWWRQWKTPRRRRAALLALRVPLRLARNTAGSGRGPWYLARSRALAMGLPMPIFGRSDSPR